MNKLPVLTAAVAAFAFGVSSSIFAADTYDITDGSPYYYQATKNPTGDVNDPEQIFHGVGGLQGTTDSGINHLPVYHGHMQTTQTYRFVNVAEQVFTMVGDGKHGMWRYQDNGSVRLYITDEAEAAGYGVPADWAAGKDLADPHVAQDFALTLNVGDIIGDTGDDTEDADYTHFDDSASFGVPGGGGYKSFNGFNGHGATTGDGVGGIINVNENLTFLDVPIFHPFFGGKYDNHVPIDLAAWYCTMSWAGYPAARAIMDFAFVQPGARDIGPLGERAGIDITEYYTKVLRLHHFGDAQTWINTLDTAPGIAGTDDVHWRRLNTAKTKVEYYLVERPFFNEDYIFLIAVFDDKGVVGKGEFSYVRPDGPYYEHLMARGETLNTSFKQFSKYHVFEEKNGKLKPKYDAIEGLRLYGTHHPGFGDRPDGDPLNTQFGACPAMGGDFGEDFFGAAWPSNYQEVTPVCDGFVADIKFYADLDGASWGDENKNLANNTGSINGVGPPVTKGGLVKNYKIRTDVSGGIYGDYTDPFLEGAVNGEEFIADSPDQLTFPSANPQVTCVEVNDGDCPNSPPQSP